MVKKTNRHQFATNLCNALIEAKESIEGKRKLLPGQANKFERNTLDNLINELRVYVNTTQE